MTLWHALHLFPSRAAIAEYAAKRNAATEAGAVVFGALAATAIALWARSPMPELTAEHQATLAKGGEVDRALKQLQSIVRHWLLRGALVAYGYEKPRRIADLPQVIPTDVWKGTIDWTASGVRGAGIDALEVRVLHPTWIDALRQRTVAQFAATSLAKPNSKGRPSLKQEIIECYRELERGGHIDLNAPMKRCYPAIRRALAAKFENRSGQIEELSDETIRARISPLFRDARTAAKTEKS